MLSKDRHKDLNLSFLPVFITMLWDGCNFICWHPGRSSKLLKSTESQSRNAPLPAGLVFVLCVAIHASQKESTQKKRGQKWLQVFPHPKLTSLHMLTIMGSKVQEVSLLVTNTVWLFYLPQEPSKMKGDFLKSLGVNVDKSLKSARACLVSLHVLSPRCWSLASSPAPGSVRYCPRSGLPWPPAPPLVNLSELFLRGTYRSSYIFHI